MEELSRWEEFVCVIVIPWLINGLFLYMIFRKNKD